MALAELRNLSALAHFRSAVSTLGGDVTFTAAILLRELGPTSATQFICGNVSVSRGWSFVRLADTNSGATHNYTFTVFEDLAAQTTSFAIPGSVGKMMLFHLVYTGTAVSVYVNGILLSTTATAGNAFSSSTGRFSIGYDSNAGAMPATDMSFVAFGYSNVVYDDSAVAENTLATIKQQEITSAGLPTALKNIYSVARDSGSGVPSTLRNFGSLTPQQPLEVVGRTNLSLSSPPSFLGDSVLASGGGGGGDVSGPGASTDNAVARWDGATGTLAQNSVVIIDDSGNTTTPGAVLFADATNDVSGFTAPVNYTTPTVWTLPLADGLAGTALTTDGAGTLSWAAGGGGGSLQAAYDLGSDVSLSDAEGSIAIDDAALTADASILELNKTFVGTAPAIDVVHGATNTAPTLHTTRATSSASFNPTSLQFTDTTGLAPFTIIAEPATQAGANPGTGLLISAQAGGTGNQTGGTLEIYAGFGSGTGAGGDLFIAGGSSPAGASGGIFVLGGDAGLTGDGGNAQLSGGSAIAGVPGQARVIGGTSAGVGNPGADVQLIGGEAAVEDGGNISVFGGINVTGGQTNGALILKALVGAPNLPRTPLYFEDNSGDRSGFVAPAAYGTPVLYTLPTDDGALNEVLTTDGAGTLSWAAAATGTVTGTGTANTVSIWSAASVLADSTVSAGTVLLGSGVGAGAGAGQQITVQSGVGGATGVGGAVLMQGGAGGATSGAGGATTLQGGTATTSGAGGAVAINGGLAVGTNQVGGVVRINTTNGTSSTTLSTGTASGPFVQIFGGGGGATGAGGSVFFRGGNGGATSGDGGNASLQGGNATTSGAGGAVLVTGGTAVGTAAGGSISITSGSGATTAAGSGVTIAAGAGVGSNQNGGNIVLTPGAATGSGVIGHINLAGIANAASTTATPAGGSVTAVLLFGTTAGFGIYYGSGAPTVTAAQGSIYLRSDGTGIADRMYVNTNGTTGWTNFVSAT